MLSRGLTLSPELAAWLPEYWGNDWDFYWTKDPLHERAGAKAVRDITAEDARPVVAAANPRSEAFDDFESYRWYGIWSAGVLASVIGAKDDTDVAGRRNSYLGGLGTLPEYRGRGLAGDIMTAVTAFELETHSLVTFGMWAEKSGASPLRFAWLYPWWRPDHRGLDPDWSTLKLWIFSRAWERTIRAYQPANTARWRCGCARAALTR